MAAVDRPLVSIFSAFTQIVAGICTMTVLPMATFFAFCIVWITMPGIAPPSLAEPMGIPTVALFSMLYLFVAGWLQFAVLGPLRIFFGIVLLTPARWPRPVTAVSAVVIAATGALVIDLFGLLASALWLCTLVLPSVGRWHRQDSV